MVETFGLNEISCYSLEKDQDSTDEHASRARLPMIDSCLAPDWNNLAVPMLCIQVGGNEQLNDEIRK